MIIGFIVLFVIISSTILALLFIEDAKEETANHTQFWAELIAKTNSKDLIDDNEQAIEDNLLILKGVPYINYVHIYKVHPSPKGIIFFTSYNKSNNSSGISEKDSQISILSTPTFSKYAVEFITPINYQSEIVGYVYIQVNTEKIQELTTSVYARLTVVVLLLSLVTFLIVLSLNHFITSPMSNMVTQIQQIYQQKKFDIRLPVIPYKELDILARNINIMLDRAETQLVKLTDAEQFSYQQNLELENKVNKRTQALKDSNQELLSTLEKLHQFQGQLVESEKMASLGDMVAGVAHEVNTPIGLGITASTLLSDRLSEIKDAFEDKTLKSSQLKKFLIEGEENTAIIYRNLKRAAELITSFKQVAVDQTIEEERSFNVKELFNEILLTLAPQIKNTPYVINIDCPESLTIQSKPGPITQIIINLILNSIIHGFDNKVEGTIDITITQFNENLDINYQDDGTGIDQSIFHKIFEPFTTTKRGSGGSGLGLHLVYNLVTQALNGKIDCISEIDNGVKFTISFPVQMVNNV
ncbi:MAG: HAMP domain-containing histidine kinase [Colwellia sp.]|nr:HAMP domain-containing histidine kinase [Colwellia sp.]